MIAASFWQDHFAWLTWTAAGVLTALALGLFNLIEPRVQRWQEHRRAEIEVRFERYWPRGGGAYYRMVVVNYGPSVADLVYVDAKTQREGDWSIKARVGRLLPRQEWHYSLDFEPHGASKWLYADVSWSDSRPGRQKESKPRLLSRQDHA